MEAAAVTGVLAVLFAGGAGCGLGASLHATLRRVRFSATGVGSGSSGLGDAFAWLMRNGVLPLEGLAPWALRMPWFSELAEECCVFVRLRGFVVTERSASTLLLAFFLLLTLAAYAVSGSPVCAIAVSCCAAVGLASAARGARERRSAAIREEIPDVIRAMSVCLGAGMTLLQTLEHISADAREPLRGFMRSASSILETGGTTKEALALLGRIPEARELAFVAVALDVQHQSGGSVRPILDSAREAAQDEMDLRRSLRVQTAQAKLSARIVTVMPFALIALFSLISEGFLEPFFTSATGMALLFVALAMQAAGVLIIRQMLKIEEG